MVDFASVAVHAPERSITRTTIASQDGEVRTWTQSLAGLGGLLIGSGCAPSCEPGAAFTSIPSGTLTATWTGGRLQAPFRMVADFTASSRCNCSRGEYRQYVRGTFTSNGSPVTHVLGPGRDLSPTTFQEDGDLGLGTAYGHRATARPKNVYSPNSADGCHYEGEDEPGITGSSGTQLTMNLDFRGDLIDTGRGDAVIASASWSVTGSATVP